MLGWSMIARAWRSASNRAITRLSMPGFRISGRRGGRMGMDCWRGRRRPAEPPSPICSSRRNGPIVRPMTECDRFGTPQQRAVGLPRNPPGAIESGEKRQDFVSELPGRRRPGLDEGLAVGRVVREPVRKARLPVCGPPFAPLKADGPVRVRSSSRKKPGACSVPRACPPCG